MREELDRVSEFRDITRSELVREAIDFYLDEKELRKIPQAKGWAHDPLRDPETAANSPAG